MEKIDLTKYHSDAKIELSSTGLAYAQGYVDGYKAYKAKVMGNIPLIALGLTIAVVFIALLTAIF